MKIPDWRHIENGNVIPTYAYSDQPYIVKSDDGAWVCTTTTGIGVEGAVGECVVVSRSTDNGLNWSMPLKIDYDDTDYAYAVPTKAPNGRLYCFYNHNTDRVQPENLFGKRCDMGGHFVFKYSSDNGVTWSKPRLVNAEHQRRNQVIDGAFITSGGVMGTTDRYPSAQWRLSRYSWRMPPPSTR